MPFGALTDTLRFAIDRRRPIAVIAPVASTLPSPLRQLNLQETRLMRMDSDLVATLLELNYPGTGRIASRLEAAQLARLTPEDFVLALREDDAASAINILLARCQPAPSGKQSLRDFPLPADIRAPLDRIMNDLKSWSSGDIPWSEVTRGLLLEGPPGTGKTEVARLIAGEAGFAVVACSLSKWSSAGSKSGDVIKAMKASFAEAASKAPCVLFIDEIDGFGDRARNPDHNSAYTAYVVGALLECLDGYETLEGVIAVAATNHVSMVDAAIRRAGRFDAVVTLAHPSVELLPQALRWHLGAELRDENLDRLALSACGMSGAEIASAVRLAKSKSRTARRPLTSHDLAETIAELRPAMSPMLQHRVAIHESGHAIVAAASGKSKPKALMITARGGHLEHKLDLGAHRRQDLEAAMMIYAAGRAAEIVVFGDDSAGAGGEVGSDLERATQVAAALEVSWGHGATRLWLGAPKDAIKLMRADPKIQQRVSLQLSRAERLKFSATFETVPKAAGPAVNPARFLLGAELSWDMLAAQADMARDIHPEIREIIADTLEQGEYRLLLLMDQPGAGKTSFLKRLAYDFSQGSNPVFWYSGLGLELEPQDCAAIFDRFKTPVVVFVDNFADSLNSISLIMERINKRDILFVCTERDHRLAYIEGAFSGEEYLQIKDVLKLRLAEAERLRKMHEEEGLSTIDKLPTRTYQAEVVGKAIAEANCRIQKRFYSIDRITRDLIRECDAAQHGAYLAVALARYCFSQGIRRSALAGTTGSDSIEFLLEDQAPLPIKYSDFGRNFVVPKNSLIADRLLEESRRVDDGALLQGFKDLALSLAPRVNPAAIKRKTPEAQLLGGLMDFDRNVKRFIDNHAEEYYAALKASCGWNARYWEQLSLMKLDRFFTSPEDLFLLEESIQNARSALSREMHPFSLATLAKVLFKAMEQRPDNRDALFQEAWDNILDADDREKKWPSRGATVFVICFAGVLKYLDMGGQLNGAQYERLREMVQATHRHNFKEKNLIEKRGLIEAVL